MPKVDQRRSESGYNRERMLRATNWMLSIALSAVLPGLAQVSDWQIGSAHSAAQFSVRHMMVSNVRGHFGKTTGSARFDPKAPAKATVEAAGAGRLKLVGDLTMHGVTREVTLDVEGPTPEMKDARGGGRIGAVATARISRKEFGMTWNRAIEAGGVAVSDEVAITIDVELVRKP